MIYRLKELKGDTIAVPQLVFSKLGIAEEYNVRVALYVLATGITDPDKICADLKLRSRISAESALSFWAGAGLLERYEENAAPGEEPSDPRTHDLGRDRCGQPHRPHDLQPDRLRTDRLCPSADPQGDGKAGQPLYAGGLCAGDRDAVHRLRCQHRPQHHGRRSA